MAHVKLYGKEVIVEETGPIEERYANTRKEMKEHLKEKMK